MAVKYTKVNEQKLLAFSTKVLEKAGLPSEDAPRRILLPG